MKKPVAIWACDGETPYFYEEGEERPEAAVRYVRSDQYADILQELSALEKNYFELIAKLKNAARIAEDKKSKSK